jgi:RNA polymerase sigma-70 factor (ECF subfamily)
MGVNQRDLAASSDEELLALVAAESAEALHELYERHAGWLVLRLTRRCSDREVVDEVVQDTFMGVWRNAAGFRGEGPVAAWIWGIGIRRLVERFRRRPVPTRGWDMSRPQASAEELVLLGLEHGDLAAAMDGLSPELRAVLRATVLDGLTTREAAILLGIPQGTVKSRMRRARRELREALA